METPSAVALANGTALFGSPTFEWAAREAFVLSGSAREDFSGVWMARNAVNSTLPLPRGVKYQLEPLAAQGGSTPGVAHVFWGTSPQPARGAANTVTGIAYARFDGTTWSEPEQVVTATNITWARTAASLLAADSVIDVVAPGYTTLGATVKLGLVHVRVVGSTATVTWNHLDAFVAYTALARRTDGAGIVAMIAALPKPSGDRAYGVFAKSLAPVDSGRAATLIHALPSDTIGYWVSAVRRGDVLHVFWVQVGRTAKTGATIMHASSRDDGRSWMPHEPLLVHGGTDVLQVAQLNGTTLVVLRDPDTHLIGWTYWRNNRWGAVQRPFREWAISVPTLLQQPAANSIALTWGVGITGAIPAAPSFPAPSQRISVLRVECLDHR